MRTIALPLLVTLLALASPARADEAPAAAVAAAPAADAPAPPPPAPYSLPWQLRPAMPVSVVRSDTNVGFSEDAMGRGVTTTATMLLAAYKVTPSLAPLLRLGVVHTASPDGTPGGAAFANPLVGGIYGFKLDDVRIAAFFGFAMPFGQGGGDTPDADAAAAMRSGILTRAAMDNAMFVSNFMTFIPGVDVAWVKGGFTAQLEMNVLQLVRVRGSKVEKDEARTNLVVGGHAGYFVLPNLSFGGELRYQRWLSTPAAVAADATGASRDTLNFAVGPRGHFKVANVWLRPGISYARGLDDPMSRFSYHIVQFDLPVVF